MFVVKDGCKVWIRVHDRYYIRERLRLFVAAVGHHPDGVWTRANNVGVRFGKKMQRLRRFEQAERAWYALFGLQPPTPRDAKQSRIGKG